MDKIMTDLEKEIKNLKEQNKILLDRMEKHIDEKSDMRKELYNYANPQRLNGSGKITEQTFKEGTD